MAAELLSNPFSNQKEMQTATGSCLCGAVTYTISGTPSTTVLCHCISCKKSSGSSFMANGFYESSQLNINSSTLTLRTYIDKSPDAGGVVERSFCSECGSPLFIRNPKYPRALIIASGTLDYKEGLDEWKPEMEFYCKRKGPWLETVGAEVEKKFDGMS